MVSGVLQYVRGGHFFWGAGSAGVLPTRPIAAQLVEELAFGSECSSVLVEVVFSGLGSAPVCYMLTQRHPTS